MPHGPTLYQALLISSGKAEGSKAGRGIEIGDNIVISPSKDAAKAAAAKVVKLRLPTLFSRWAGREGFVANLPPAAQERARAPRAALARFLERLPHGWSEAARRYGEELCSLP